MRVQLLLGLALIVLASPGAVGAPAQIQFRVQPGGVIVEDQDLGQIMATSPSGDTANIELPTDTSTDHHYRISRPHFDPISLTVNWSTVHQRWHFSAGHRGGWLEPETLLSLSRTIRLNVKPADVDVYIDSDDDPSAAARMFPGASVVAGEVDLEVGGMKHHVLALPKNGDMVQVPRAWKPPILYLSNKWFQATSLTIEPGVLDTESDVYPETPIVLQPRYGPFSYPAFNGVLVVSLLAGAGAWIRWTWPLKKAALQEREMTRIQRAEERAQGPAPVWENQTVTTERGVRYLLMEPLGHGAMGIVYEAVPVAPGDKTPVAVKILLADSEQHRVRFEREIRVCETLVHPNIVKILDCGLWERQGGKPALFMVMERVSGQTLRQQIRQGPVPPEYVVAWMAEILQGLHVAHFAGIVHRDIKPENVMVTDNGQIKIMDFGVAHVSQQTMTQTNTSMGTPLYMSPEHLNAKTVTGASDIYSVAVVGYEMLSGRTPYELDEEGNLWSLMSKMLDAPPPSLAEICPWLPVALTGLIMAMLERNPADRPNIRQVLTALSDMA